MPASRWRGRRDLPGPLADDDVAVTHRIVTGSELQQPAEDEPAAAVEAEHELIEVALQMRFLDRALRVLRSHRLASEATRCTAGSSSPGSSPRTRAARWLRR